MKQFRIGNKEYLIKYTVGNMKTFKGVTNEELQSGDLTKMICHTSELLYVGLKGLDRKITPQKTDEIMDDYLEDGGSLTDLLTDLTDEYVSALGLNSDSTNNTKKN